MKPYTDIFKQPITIDDVRLAVQVLVSMNSASPSLLQRRMKIGYGKAATILRLLEDARVVSAVTSKPRVLILKHEAAATNAALRQLRKAKK